MTVTVQRRLKRLVRDIADANISVTCMPITPSPGFDFSTFWSMVTTATAACAASHHTAVQVMTVDPDMDAVEEQARAFSWSALERRHMAHSFKQRALAALPLRFSGASGAAVAAGRVTVRRRLQHHGAGFLPRHGG
jgi:hypothetical protein